MQQNKIRILLIDDDEEDFLITQDLLEEIPNRLYAIDWVDNFDEGLHLAVEQKYQIYFVDYRLGARTGLELIEEALNAGCESPLILLTGQVDTTIDEKATKAGAADFLSKGEFSALQLERSIRYNLEKARNLQKINELNRNLELRVKERTRQLQSANEQLVKEINEKQQAEMALRESQALLQAIARNFPGGFICVFNEELEIVFMDGSELKRFGKRSEELAGKKIAEILPDMPEQYEQNVARCFQEELISFEIELRNCTYLNSCVLLPDQEGNTQKILVVSHDISEEKEASDKILLALEKERELGELKSRFVQMASHEFKTPLSTILSSVSLLKRYAVPITEEKPQRQLNRIQSSIKQLNAILEDFLSLSVLEEGKFRVNLTEIDLPEFLEAICDDMHSVAKNGQEINFQYNGEDPILPVDKNILLNILTNLVSNALKYSPEDASVQVITDVRDNKLLLDVIDQGLGIPDEDQQYLFDRFFRAKNAVNIQGTGLGLNIVKKYVDLLEGSISFESKINKGTQFHIQIPLAYD